jgi:predicted secreted hydrolase
MHWLFRFLLARLVAIALFAASPDFRQALPGYRYQFSRDHFNHPEFRTEWWYYTGNLQAKDGHRYGFELVFFRQGEQRPSASDRDFNPSVWRVDDLYLAHLALTDIDGRAFHTARRLNRAGPGLAGASFEEGRIWNGNWQATWDKASDRQTLRVVAEGIRFTLDLNPAKPAVIHGENGVSQKAEGPGRASYYVSFPRLNVSGEMNGRAVHGLAWMDHEWFTDQLADNQRGWDWFSIQLENRTELMLFEIRRADGSIDPFSAGTYIAADGKATHLASADFSLTPLAFWTSPTTHARYPIQWRIRIPRLKLELECAAAIPQQELSDQDNSTVSYWEGAVTYSGSAGGVGYLEMTGYAGKVKL